jgi:hypothetical protein
MNNMNRRLARNYQSVDAILVDAAERLPTDELKERVQLYEDNIKKMQTTKGIRGLLLKFSKPPIILDNVNPFHGAEPIYMAVRHVLTKRTH